MWNRGKTIRSLDTKFGKLGMMICYDGFFPRSPASWQTGAEVIAWPVMGCNPRRGAARAIENHVYVVSSTYEHPGQLDRVDGL